MTKYIFITDNIDHFKKSIFIASLGALLKKNNLRINIKKITISKPPRTFVTSSGLELDIDLGHYERITEINTNLINNILLCNYCTNIKNKVINFIEFDSINYDIILIDCLEKYCKDFLKYNKKNIFIIKELPKIFYDYSNIEQIPYITYKLPYLLYDFQLQILQNLNIEHINNLKFWQKMYNNIINIEKEEEINIYIIIKYTDSYLSFKESLEHASYFLKKKIKIIWVDPIYLSKNYMNKKGGILVPGGFGHNGFENKIEAIKFARENNIPFLGVCYGMQIMVIEYARNVLNISNATTEEIDYSKSFTHVVHLIGLKDKFNYIKRLGNYNGMVNKKDSIAGNIYKLNFYIERYRHNYKINEKYINELEKNGLLFTGSSSDNQIIEIVELPTNNFYMGVQFHPEFVSTILKPHPVLISFIKSIQIYLDNLSKN
jgi:CTP synthase (UTP-ammonia lyase)